MSPLYAWERSTWDSHPFRALYPFWVRHPRRWRFSLPLLSLFPRPFYPLPSRSFRRRYPSTPFVSRLPSLSLYSPFAALPHCDSADTRTRRSGHTANRKLNSRQRARRAWSQLRGARGTKLNDHGVFSAPAATILPVDIEGQNGTSRKEGRETEKDVSIYIY